MMIVAAAFALLAAAGLAIARLFAGPTLYDRVLAVNAFGTKTVLFLAVFAFVIDRPDAIDIAILYALINFVATIAILKFFRYRAFDLALARMGADESGVGADVEHLTHADADAEVVVEPAPAREEGDDDAR